MDVVDGALDNVKNAMDNAIQRINKEIKMQKLKSDSLCQLKTAHNWQEEKEQKVREYWTLIGPTRSRDLNTAL